MDPIRNSTEYDSIVLEGQRSPGICEVSTASKPRKWDIRDGNGQSGATLAFKGVGLAKFKVRIRLTTPEDFDAWDAWKPLVLQDPEGKDPKGKDIYHPDLDELGITSAVVEEPSQREQSDTGEHSYTIAFIQYRQPKPAGGVAKGSSSQGWRQDKSAGDEADKMINDLLKQVKELA